MRKENEKRDQNNKTYISMIIFVLIIIGVTNMNACGFLGIGNTASWKEEVLLHDGSKIIVERWQKHGGRGEIGQSPIREHSITFTLPNTKKIITWKDEYSEDVGRSNFVLVALHILNATPYIIANPNLCMAYNKWDRPNPPYVIFKYENKEWKRINMAGLPLEFKNINLVIFPSQFEKELVSRSVTSVEMVKELNSALTQAEYKTIVHAPIDGVGCPDWRNTNFKAPIPIAPKVKGAEK